MKTVMIKMFYGLIYNQRLALLVLFFSVALVAFEKPVIAEEEISGENVQLVEVELKADPYAPQLDRKSNSSKRLSIGYENFFPENYRSPADQAKYSELVGNNILPITQLNFGWQYNSKIGAIYADLFYGMGAVSGASTGFSTTISVTRYGLSLGVFLDTIFKEPYVSPFAGFQVFAVDWKESCPAQAINLGSVTNMMYSYQFGIAIHLDKLDPDSSKDAYNEYGLKNSFIDIYGTQTLKSASGTDPDFSTAFNYGIDFRFEF